MDVLEIVMRATFGIVAGPVWLAFFIGVIVGWSWKPNWATLGFWTVQFFTPAAPSAGPVSLPPETGSLGTTGTSPSQTQREHLDITEEDLDHLWKLVQRKDGGPVWKQMMDRSTSGMSYQAWQRDPATGPPQYCSRSVFEDATPEMVRDFFWDDKFRLQWDDMILHATTIDTCQTTGTMAVHWIRKFPFFCSDREYIIGRRIWETGTAYYCVTKGVPCPSVPRRQTPKRVDLYYSSWFIQPVPSMKGNGEMTACEVVLFHHEEMGIPWEIAKFGVKRGMWNAVKKLEAGLRAYQSERGGGSPLSHAALMAQINTRIDPNRLASVEGNGDSISVEGNGESPETNSVSLPRRPRCRKVRKLIIIGGIVFLACRLDRGLLSKTLMFGAATKVSNK